MTESTLFLPPLFSFSLLLFLFFLLFYFILYVKWGRKERNKSLKLSISSNSQQQLENEYIFSPVHFSTFLIWDQKLSTGLFPCVNFAIALHFHYHSRFQRQEKEKGEENLFTCFVHLCWVWDEMWNMECDMILWQYQKNRIVSSYFHFQLHCFCSVVNKTEAIATRDPITNNPFQRTTSPYFDKFPSLLLTNQVHHFIASRRNSNSSLFSFRLSVRLVMMRIKSQIASGFLTYKQTHTHTKWHTGEKAIAECKIIHHFIAHVLNTEQVTNYVTSSNIFIKSHTPFHIHFR